MTNQSSQEELNKECEAIIIQMRRDNRKNALKFGAFVILMLMLATVAIAISVTIPPLVMQLMGQ